MYKIMDSERRHLLTLINAKPEDLAKHVARFASMYPESRPIIVQDYDSEDDSWEAS